MNIKLKSLLYLVITVAVLTASLNTRVFAKIDPAEVMSQLDIMEIGEENPEITRGEMATALINLIMGKKQSELVYKDVFADVTYGHKDSIGIYASYVFGIVKGDTDGNFRPDDILTYDEAVTMVVNVLGYKEIANQTSYMATAYRIGLLKNITPPQNGKMTQSDASRLIFNAMDISMMISYIADGEIKYETAAGDTPLKAYLGLTYGKGVVTRYLNSTTSESPQKGTKEDEVVIGNTIFKAGDFNFVDKLGYSFGYYYKETDGIKTLVCVVPLDNQVITVNNRDVAKCEDYRVSYYVDETLKKAKFSKYTDVVIDGKAKIDYSFADLGAKDNSGITTFIDNDNDGTYDVIIITNPKNHVVHSIDMYNKIIYTKNLDAIDTEKYEHVYIYNKDRKKATLEDIKENDVVSVVASGNRLEITVSDIKTEDEIESIDDKSVTLASGKTHFTDPDFRAETNLILGKKASFLFDWRGNICGTYDDAFKSPRGYLKTVAKESGISSDVKVKIFTADGTFIVLNVPKNISVDGENMSSDDFYKTFTAIDTENGGETYTKMQVVAYETNAAGDGLVRLDTAKQGKFENETNLKVDSFKDETWLSSPYGINTLDSTVSFMTDSTVFCVPMLSSSAAPSDSNKFSDEDFQVMKGTEKMYDFQMTKPRLDAVDTDDGGISDIMVYYYTWSETVKEGGNFTDIGKYNESVMVEKVFDVYENGNTVTKLSYYFKDVTYTVEAVDKNVFMKPVYDKNGKKINGKFKPLHKGDIIRIRTDFNGRATNIYVDLDVERSDNGIFASYTDNSSFDVGILYKKTGIGMKLLTTLNNNPAPYNPLKPLETFDVTDVHVWPFSSGTTAQTIFFATYDRETGSITRSEYDDLIDCETDPANASLVFIRVTNRFASRVMYIIK